MIVSAWKSAYYTTYAVYAKWSFRSAYDAYVACSVTYDASRGDIENPKDLLSKSQQAYDKYKKFNKKIRSNPEVSQEVKNLVASAYAEVYYAWSLTEELRNG